MGEQEGRLNRQAKPLNLNHEEYKDAEEKVLRAFAALRLLNAEGEALSLEQAISRSRQLSQEYKRWVESNASIKSIEVRLSSGAKIVNTQSNSSFVCELSFNDNLPPDTVINIWKAADLEFGEVLLISLPLSNIPPDGYFFEREYPNGQTLSLRVEHRPSGAFAISVGVNEPNVQLRASTSRFYTWLSQTWWSRNPYAYAALSLVLMISLGLNVLLGRKGFVELPDPELARVFIQNDPQPPPNVLSGNTLGPNQISNSIPENEMLPQQSNIRRAHYYVSSLDDDSARSKYCITGEFKGDSLDSSKVIDLTLSEANLSLCSFSSHGARRIDIKVGLTNASEYGLKKTDAVLWSQSITLSERLNPGEAFSLPNPIRISIPKRRSVDVAKAKIVIQVITMPYDSNREYRLASLIS
jgi:hypothetical protein